MIVTLYRNLGALLSCVLIAAAASGCSGSDGGSPDGPADGGLDSGSDDDCEPPMQRCGSRCINTRSDVRHCGSCSRECRPGAYCERGECVGRCSADRTQCDEGCVDLLVDREHCGECGNACPETRECTAGRCVCDDSLTDCSGVCVNTDLDEDNCGLCGRSCGNNEACSGGSCIPTRELDCHDGEDDDGDGDVDCDDSDCEGTTRECEGVCGTGVETCNGDGTWTECQGGSGEEEVCGDGIDQDCDGEDLTNPDSYEPNDTCAQCWMIPETDPDVTIRARIDSVTDTRDCFKFRASDDFNGGAREFIDITLSDIPPGSDFDLRLYEDYEKCEANEPMEESLNGGTEDEHIRWGERFAASDDGTYYVTVDRFYGYSCDEDYRLDIDGLN